MLDRDAAIRIAQSRSVISQPGKYQVKVTNSPNLMVKEDISTEGPSRYLVNVNAMSLLQASELRQNIKDADELSLSDYQETLNSCNLVASINFGGSHGEVAPDWVPVKGEYVNIIVDKVHSKRRDADVLGVVAIEPVPVSVSGSTKFSFDAPATGETEEPVTEGAALETTEA